jgi:hypothetical protein
MNLLDVRVISAFTRVFDALLPAHDDSKERHMFEEVIGEVEAGAGIDEAGDAAHGNSRSAQARAKWSRYLEMTRFRERRFWDDAQRRVLLAWNNFRLYSSMRGDFF